MSLGELSTGIQEEGKSLRRVRDGAGPTSKDRAHSCEVAVKGVALRNILRS